MTSDGNGVKGTRTRIHARKATVKVRSRKCEVRSARTTRTHTEPRDERGRTMHTGAMIFHKLELVGLKTGCWTAMVERTAARRRIDDRQPLPLGNLHRRVNWVCGVAAQRVLPYRGRCVRAFDGAD